MTDMTTQHRDGSYAASPALGARTVLLGLLMVGSIVAGIVFCVALANPSGIVLFVAYGATGAYLVIRRPANSIGWLLVVTAWGLGLGTVPVPADAAAASSALDPTQAFALWANNNAWGFAFVGLVGLVMVFPDGRMPGGRARWPSRLVFAASVLLAVLIAFKPAIQDARAHTVANPLAIAPQAAIWSVVPETVVLYSLIMVALVFGLVVLFVRARRATALARLQYRWLVAAIALVTVVSSIWALATFAFDQDPIGPAYVVSLLVYPSVPLAIAIAVLRYRLFEIDRIISRTLGYAVVTATLAVVFVGIVLGLQAVLEQFVGGNTIAVAASTLTVAALFQPLRRRVQRIVDRRFNRARYDAQRTAEAFADQLRMETDMETLISDLTAVVEEALAPQSAGLWVRENEVAR